MADVTSLEAALEQRHAHHLYRHRRLLTSAQGVEVTYDGRRHINFSSSDYLGLANHPVVVKAFQQAANEYGMGSVASPLVCGYTALHHKLEEILAELTGRDRVLMFTSGYMANLGVITALVGRCDTIFADKLNHASLVDAGVLSRARLRRFAHNNMQQLARDLSSADCGRRLIVVESVFSMDGDCAPLAALASLAQQHDAWLMADDAHGFGVLGAHGGGCAEYYALDQQQLPIVMGTLSKAVGCYGAFVAGSETIIETLIQFSRSYTYTTALPPAVVAAGLASVQLLREEPQRRTQLQQRITYFKRGASQLGLPLLASDTPIQPLLVGDNKQALAVASALEEGGFLVVAMRPPTVPLGAARLRITLSAAHSEYHLDRLLDALADMWAKR